MNVRGEVHAYLVPEDYRRLRLEALARGVSLSRCAGDCLAEYFALRQEMAMAFETPHQAGQLTPPRVIHVLLAQTEQRLVATLERYGEDQHLTSDPKVCGGQLCARGTRVLVTVILDNLAEGLGREEILRSYPTLEPIHLDAALAYAAELAREESLLPLKPA